MEVLDDGLARCGVSVEHEACVAVWEALTRHAANRSRAVCVHGEVLSHGIGDAIAILAALNAALGDVLDLGTPINRISKNDWLPMTFYVRTCSGTKFVQIAPSC